MIAIALTLLSTSCETAPDPVEPVPPPTIDLDWPDFPDPDDAQLLETGETVTVDGSTVVVPLDWWLAMTDYVIEIRRVREQLESVYGGPADRE
ncbi:MAG: hypothetical protein ACOC2N_07295 [Spirochaetota bacterium]